jgi:hypothetical protein
MSEYKCCLCKKELDGYSAYEYRGFVSCEEHSDAVIEKVDIRRGEIISRNNAVLKPLEGLDLSSNNPIGKHNRELLAPVIEIASKETFAEKQYRNGEL